MKLLIDQNISHRIIPLIEAIFPNARHVKDFDLIDANDFEIFMYARKHGFDAVVTLDEDFSNLQAVHNSPPKILWLRLGNCTTKKLAEVLVAHYNAINEFLYENDFDCFEIF